MVNEMTMTKKQKEMWYKKYKVQQKKLDKLIKNTKLAAKKENKQHKVLRDMVK